MFDAGERAKPSFCRGLSLIRIPFYDAGHFVGSGHNAAESPFGEPCDSLFLGVIRIPFFEAGHFAGSGHNAAESPFGERCDSFAPRPLSWMPQNPHNKGNPDASRLTDGLVSLTIGGRAEPRLGSCCAPYIRGAMLDPPPSDEMRGVRATSLARYSAAEKWSRFPLPAQS